jgi:Fe-S cluster biosynthesis and repair protein YggX
MRNGNALVPVGRSRFRLPIYFHLVTDLRSGRSNRMSTDTPERDTPRLVTCAKLGRELPGLDEPPWPGELGQRIYNNVSAEAWQMWEDRMRMILNEYRLMPWQKEAQDLMARYMEEFFFGESSALPPGYVPENQR